MRTRKVRVLSPARPTLTRSMVVDGQTYRLDSNAQAGLRTEMLGQRLKG
ncbi:hypothetical protein [Pandoraea iniqua]|nr:hypothetical protein [Pandoraea iniqua]